jgi:hypothetical protein
MGLVHIFRNRKFATEQINNINTMYRKEVPNPDLPVAGELVVGTRVVEIYRAY